MPRRKKVETPEAEPESVSPGIPEESAPEAAPVAEPPSVSEKLTMWKVFGARGYIRTYSLADHGASAPELAKQFAGKVGGRVDAE